MEPVKGGSLAVMPEAVQEKFRAVHPDLSAASWAIRYCASLEGVITVLSGMSSEEQMQDNISYMKDFKPLNEEERAVIREAVAIIRNAPVIPCTGCEYCIKGCPMQIRINEMFRTYNHYVTYNNIEAAKSSYHHALRDGRGAASSCVQCGQCEGICPQHLPVIENLKKVASLFE